MALENIKKAIIALETEMVAQQDIHKRIEVAKLYLTGFYYKSTEEFMLGKYPDSRLSLRIYAVLSERMLGKYDPFYHQALVQSAEKDAEASNAFMNQKRSKINYSEEEINKVNKTTYKSFEFSEDRLNQLGALIPEQYRAKEVVHIDENTLENNDDLSSSPVNKNRNKNHLASFHNFL